MSERTDSQIIHEARGLCWHDFMATHDRTDDRSLQGEWRACRCSQIKRPFYDSDKAWPAPINPDYTDPTSYLEAMAWAERQPWWCDFLDSIQDRPDEMWHDEITVYVRDILSVLLDPKLGSHALAQFLEGREG